MFHVLSWGIPYACLMTGSPVVFNNNFTDPGAVFFFFGRTRWGSGVNVTRHIYELKEKYQEWI